MAFLYNKLLDQPLGNLGFQHAKQGRRMPVVLESHEVQKILSCLNERDHLVFSLLYGSGLRISECLRIRIQDINLDQGNLAVRCSKGNKDRTTILSRKLAEALNKQKSYAQKIQQGDNIRGYGPSLPFALSKKYPNAFR